MKGTRKFNIRIKDLGDIARTEVGDLLLMAIAHITTTTRTSKTPDEVIAELQQNRSDAIYTCGEIVEWINTKIDILPIQGEKVCSCKK